MALNEYQFHYVAPGYKKKKRGATGSATEACQRRDESHGKVIATHAEHGVVGAMSFSHMETPSTGMGRGVDTLIVDPRHRGQGLSDAMYHLASHEMGYPLGHSKSLTAAGVKFAQRVGGPVSHGREPRRTHPDILVTENALNNPVMRRDLKSNATPIDQNTSNALQRGPKPKKPKAVKQGTLPGVDWSQY